MWCYKCCVWLTCSDVDFRCILTTLLNLEGWITIPHRALNITLPKQLKKLCPLTLRAEIYIQTSAWLILILQCSVWKHFKNTYCTGVCLCSDCISLKVTHASVACWQHKCSLTFDRNFLDLSWMCCDAYAVCSFWVIAPLIKALSPSDPCRASLHSPSHLSLASLFPSSPSSTLPFLSLPIFTPSISPTLPVVGISEGDHSSHLNIQHFMCRNKSRKVGEPIPLYHLKTTDWKQCSASTCYR